MGEDRRACTCHSSEAPQPCQHRYALSDCRRAALVEKVARAHCFAQGYIWDRHPEFQPAWTREAVAMLDLALEEAAKVADRYEIPMAETSASYIAAAIRALKATP